MREIIRAPRLLGIIPLLVPCHAVIAVAGHAVIERPGTRVPGVDQIVRGDMVGSLVRRDDLPPGTSLISHLNIDSTFMTRRKLHAFGQSILAAHRQIATNWRALRAVGTGGASVLRGLWPGAHGWHGRVLHEPARTVRRTPPV